MTIEEQIQKLAKSQAELKMLQQKLSESRKIMQQESAQIFVFELRDYLDSLSIVTDFTEQQPIKTLKINEIGEALGTQNQLLQQLVVELQQRIKEDRDFFGQKEGALRRIFFNLQGILEVNDLMLQDNLVFQKKFGDASDNLELEEELSVKRGLINRFFKRN